MKKSIVSAAIFCLLFGLLGNVFADQNKESKKLITDDSNIASDFLSEEILKPYLWFYPSGTLDKEVFQKDMVERGNPNRLTMILMRWFFNEENLNDIVFLTERVIAEWELRSPNNMLTYKQPHGKIPAGWRSGMDSWGFPLFLVFLSEKTGDQTYLDLAKQLIDKAKKEVESGGLTWRLENGEGCWFSEYAWNEMKLSDEYFVLNGHLLALQSVKMLSVLLKDNELDELYKCGLQGTITKANEFLMGEQYLYYQLNKQTINPVHYIIFETMQFQALNALDEQQFYINEIDRRKNVLMNIFPIYLQKANGENRLVFSVIAPPNPYWPDSYPLAITCKDGINVEHYELPNPNNKRIPVVSRTMISQQSTLNENAICDVTSLYAGRSMKLFSTAVRTASKSAPNQISIPFHAESLYDGEDRTNGVIEIIPSKRFSDKQSTPHYLDTQARIVLSPEKEIDANYLFGINLSNSGDIHLGVTVKSNGKDFFRYYPKINKGDNNLILLSILGFDNGMEIDSIESLYLTVYTHNMEENVRIENIELLVFKETIDLVDYFMRNNPSFETK